MDTFDRKPPHIPGEVHRTEQPTEQVRQPPFRQRRNLRRAPVPSSWTRLFVKVCTQAKVELVSDADDLVEAQQNRLEVQNRLVVHFDGPPRLVWQKLAERKRELSQVAAVSVFAFHCAFERRMSTAPRPVQMMIRMLQPHFKKAR